MGQSGNFRGNPWSPLEPQYTRKDGTRVPVWGGVPHAVIGGRFSRLGAVASARSGSIRLASTLTPQQKKAGFGKVTTGQVFSQANVLGKLKGSGARYKRGDKQLGKLRAQGLLGDWAASDPIIENKGLQLRITSNRPYAARIDRLRPFAWGPQIEREEGADVLQRIDQYLRRLLRTIGGR